MIKKHDLDKFIKTHKTFGIIFTVWILLQIFLLLYLDIPEGGDNLVFPFETLNLRYYGFWEQLIYSALIVWIYSTWIQNISRDDGNDEEIFSKANAEFVSDLELSLRILDIIRGANKVLTLVSPFINLSPPIKKELKFLQETDVMLYVIFGKNERNISKSLPHNDLLLFKGFKNVQITYVDTLHAKFYANECYMILSSMNLLEYSQVMNSECGIHIKPTSYMTDSENTIWNDALAYFHDLNETGTIIYKKISNEINDNTQSYYGSELNRNVESRDKSNHVKSHYEGSSELINVGQPWTTEDEQRLLQMYRAGKSIPEIARVLERKFGGIKARLQKLEEIE